MRRNVKFILLLTLAFLISCKNKDEDISTKVGVNASASTELYQIEGVVLNVPNSKKLELMLFSIDTLDRPQRLLVSKQYKSDGNAISFQLPFELKQTDSFNNLELRGRALENGKPVEFLIPWRKITKENLKGVILELNSQSS